jgi:hypothetical protein
MNPPGLPRCRHRGPEFFPGRWACHSDRVVAFQGATAELCGNVCPYPDHEGGRVAPAVATAGEGYGVAIGTYDSLHPGKRRFGTEAVELNLAVLRATCGEGVKILVCDDASPPRSQRRYREICNRYGAGFTTNRRRMGHSSGDMIVFHKAIRWARRLGLKTVTKLSHRMLIDVPNWVQDDSDALVASGFGTRAQMLANFGLEQVRTECVMMVVDRWHSARVLEHYRPRAIPYWNETHTFQAVARFVDPGAPYPHFLPWRRLAFYRGDDRPPVFFREMQGDADALFRALARRHGVELTDCFSTVDSCRSLRYR